MAKPPVAGGRQHADARTGIFSACGCGKTHQNPDDQLRHRNEAVAPTNGERRCGRRSFGRNGGRQRRTPERAVFLRIVHDLLRSWRVPAEFRTGLYRNAITPIVASRTIYACRRDARAWFIMPLANVVAPATRQSVDDTAVHNHRQHRSDDAGWCCDYQSDQHRIRPRPITVHYQLEKRKSCLSRGEWAEVAE